MVFTSCFEKIMSIRRKLEVLVAKEAAKSATDSELSNLCQIAERLAILAEQGNQDELITEHILPGILSANLRKSH